MTRVIHTADVHLKTDAPERREALRELLITAEGNDFDVVTIGGDLFDRPEDVEELRPDLRNDLFSDRPFQVILIPGNHDIAAYRDDVFFGDSCKVLIQEPFEHWIDPTGTLRLTGLPYKERPDDELLLALQDREPFDGTEVLLLHCSLDAPFDDYEAGDEGTRRYFPVSEELLTELGFDAYLAGHYHSYHQVSFSDGSEFAYPGSPASISTDETGQRQAVIFDTNEGIDFIPLDTFHYAHQEFNALPGSEEETIGLVRDWADNHVTELAEATIHVEGFIDMDEDEFDTQLTEAAGPADVINDTRGVQHLLAHPLFRSFEDELQEMGWDDATMEAVSGRTLEVFSTLAAGGEI